MLLTDHELAERLFRAEHPRLFPFSPYGRSPQLSDLWPADQEAWVRRAAEARRILEGSPDVS
jgi:hypothetical protein